jgi:hypothetical protein
MIPTTIYLNAALPLSPLRKSSRKSANTRTLICSVISSGALYAPSSDADALPSGVSFLLEMHRRRERSNSPSQKMTRKERECLDKVANPSKHMTRQQLSLPAKSALRMTKKVRDSFLQEALDLLSDD